MIASWFSIQRGGEWELRGIQYDKVEVNTDTRGLHPNSHLGPCDEVSGSPIWNQPVKVVWVGSDSLSRGRFRIQFSRVKLDFYRHEWDPDISTWVPGEHGYHLVESPQQEKRGLGHTIGGCKAGLNLKYQPVAILLGYLNGARSAEGDHGALTIPRKSGEFKTQQVHPSVVHVSRDGTNHTSKVMVPEQA